MHRKNVHETVNTPKEAPMKAWLLPAFTGVASMSIGEVSPPAPGPGQVVLRTQFAALNPADAYLALGQYPARPALPHILGRDGVGVVTAVGAGVSGIQIGQTRLIMRSEVGVNQPGTLAEFVAVDASYLVTVPDGWSLEQAAAAPLVYVTAWQALTQWGELPPPRTILVTGASGGVGVAVIQLAHALGYRVIALSRGTHKVARLRELGAQDVLDANHPDWYKALKDENAVDLAVDNIGGQNFNRVVAAMAANGRISVVGRLAGPVHNFNTASLFFRRIRIGGVAVGTYTHDEAHAAWNSVLQTLARTGAKPLIDRVFPFAEVPAALARLAEGPIGKVLVRVTP
jgi:NADPH:quinone reductase